MFILCALSSGHLLQSHNVRNVDVPDKHNPYMSLSLNALTSSPLTLNDALHLLPACCPSLKQTSTSLYNPISNIAGS